MKCAASSKTSLLPMKARFVTNVGGAEIRIIFHSGNTARYSAVGDKQNCSSGLRYNR